MPEVPYATPYTLPTASRRPTSVTVLGILGILLAAMALLSPFSLLFQWLAFRMPAPRPAGATTNPFGNLQAQMYAGPMLAWTIGATAVHAAMGAVLLSASIASLRLRAWGRRGMIGYAWVAIPVALIAGLINGLYVVPQTFASISPPGGGPPPAFVRGIAIASGLIGGLLGMIYPVFVLVFFRRPSVAAAFEAEAASRLETAAGEGR